MQSQHSLERLGVSRKTVQVLTCIGFSPRCGRQTVVAVNELNRPARVGRVKAIKIRLDQWRLAFVPTPK